MAGTWIFFYIGTGLVVKHMARSALLITQVE